MRYYITIVKDGVVLEPLAPVEVSIVLNGGIDTTVNNSVVHLTNQRTEVLDAAVVPLAETDPEAAATPDASAVLQAADPDSTAAAEITFTAESFSIYGIVSTTIERSVLASDGHNYKITVTCSPDAQVPGNADLVVTELEGEAYNEYLARTAEVLGVGSLSYARIFDITIVSSAGNKIQPAAPVAVSIELLDAESTDQDFSVVHFADDTDVPDEMSSLADGTTVSFNTSSFSAYAIVQGPDAVPVGWAQIKTMDDLVAGASKGFCIGTTSGYFLTNATAKGSQDASTTGIVKTKPAQSYPPTGAAALYYFEPVSGTTNQVYIYCLGDDGNKKYVRNTGDANVTFTDQPVTAWTVSVENNSGRIRFNNGDRWLNMWNGANGNHIAAWTSATDGNNYFYVWEYLEVEDDPYGLNGLTYGLMNWNGATAGKALMAESSTANNLAALPLTVMAKKGKTGDGDKLFVPSDSDISMWTFEWVSNDTYRLATTVDGSKRYLRIASNGLSIVSEPDDSCTIQVIPGSGTHAGEVCLKAGNTTLTYTGSAETGFRAGGSAGSEWLKLVEVSELTSDYFMTYSAAKVSVSDPTVTNGSHVIVYTRMWNDTLKRYEFYGVDQDGSLVRCYESGDDIQWVGGRLNTMLWDFVEYYWEGTSDPNYYYELYNEFSEQYIAPQVSDGQILQDDVIGINLNGRRNGQYYTPIVAWDEKNYSYVGLKADVDAGKVVSCPIGEANDFYFAILQDAPVDGELTTVPTVDHTQYGITMKMVDFGTRKEMSDFLGSDAGGAVDNADSGLLSTNLVNGYPNTKAGNNIASWFANAKEVNHLFTQSTYSATGYYEFDATQNYAYLDGNNFRVYQEIATINNNGAHYQHGQFFPYNDLKPGTFSTVKNLTTSGGSKLSTSDPRYGEQLYLVQNPNYYLGMEVSASFTQTPNGLDDWGHDIIYEFTGDDDFWLYVDGELIIDLGGIHNALSGSVNYRTGDVYINGTHTTLRALFESNYRARNPKADQSAVNAYLAQYFDEGSTIFKDYTTHTMKIFYLERGAGASNLHMRFNLASVKPGTVQLSKALSGVDSTETITSQFPYQIKYKKKGDNTEYYLTNFQPNDPVHNEDYVFYKDTNAACTYLPELEVGGITYNDVFMLKPGEIVEINFPTFGADKESIESYSIVECGIDTTIYSSVTANGATLTGTSGADYEANRKDYGMDNASTGDRARVTYTNEVDPDALRTLDITKILYMEDGTTEIAADTDANTFSYRLYLGTEYDDPSSLPVANMHTYHVKDAQGNYCKWDVEQQKLVSLGAGKDDYDALSAEEKASVRFTSSINGSITQVPAGYTVEVRNVLAGTQFKVVERPAEMPDGYSFQKYVYEGIARNDAMAGVADTIKSGTDAHVDVCNLKGYGLRVNKVWSDADYMSERADTYFAVFTGTDEASLELVEGSVRRLAYGEKTLYWYFLPLPVVVPFNQYEIREVKLSNANPTVDANGVVSDYGTLTPVAGGGTVSLVGKQKGETTSSSFDYTVLYQRGEMKADSNVRVDTVTNNRPGIVLKKTDWAGEALAGAKFELKDADDNVIGTFTSDAEGLITVAFLRDDVAYTLSETKTPDNFHGLDAPMTLTLSDGTVEVAGVAAEWYEVTQGEGTTPTVTIKNRPYGFAAVKKDADSDEGLEGVVFALHKQHIVDGVQQFDVNPMPGYDALTTGTDGTVPKINTSLGPGTYQLREKRTLDGYEMLASYIDFTISDTGVVTLGAHPEGVSLIANVAEDGSLAYELEILNAQRRKVSFKKVDVASTDAPLEGAVFDMYTVVDGTRSATPLYAGMTSGRNGLLAHEGETVFSLQMGTYHLVETAAPAGYNLKSEPVVVTVTATDVTYDEGTALSSNGSGKSYDSGTKVYTLKVSNSSGYALPHTGGRGVQVLYALGVVLVAGASVVALRRRRA